MVVTRDERNPALRIKGVLLTTAFVSFISKPCRVEYLAFANSNSAAIDVTVQDGSGIPLFPTVSCAANTLTLVPIPNDAGLYSENGFQWKASVGAKVGGWAVARNA